MLFVLNTYDIKKASKSYWTCSAVSSIIRGTASTPTLGRRTGAWVRADWALTALMAASLGRGRSSCELIWEKESILMMFRTVFFFFLFKFQMSCCDEFKLLDPICEITTDPSCG